MMIYGEEERVCAFLREVNTDCEEPAACTTLAWEVEGRITGALSFHHFSTLNCYADIALTTVHWPRALLFAGLWYGFAQLGLRRLTFIISASNIRSINLVEKLGAYREATLQDGCSDGDAYIYCLRPDKCRIWSKMNGKEIKRLSAPGT